MRESNQTWSKLAKNWNKRNSRTNKHMNEQIEREFPNIQINI